MKVNLYKRVTTAVVFSLAIGDDDNDAVDEYSQYGTFTIAWRHD